MEKMKSLKIVLLVLAVVLVLVIYKTVGKSGFKHDAKSTIVAVNSNNFMISANDLEKNKSEFLIVELDESGSQRFENSLKISFEKLLDESNLQKLKEAESNILLVSADNSTSVKAWVILNQLNFENVFVLSEEENPEVLKYKFQPETASRLENE
jgi:uncharacterized protein (UPF0333 family)